MRDSLQNSLKILVSLARLHCISELSFKYTIHGLDTKYTLISNSSRKTDHHALCTKKRLSEVPIFSFISGSGISIALEITAMEAEGCTNTDSAPSLEKTVEILARKIKRLEELEARVELLEDRVQDLEYKVEDLENSRVLDLEDVVDNGKVRIGRWSIEAEYEGELVFRDTVEGKRYVFPVGGNAVVYMSGTVDEIVL